MDAILHSVVDAAITIPIIILLGAVALWITYPFEMGAATIMMIVWLSRRNVKLRRIQNWYFWFPIQRWFHRLYVPPRRWLMRGLMCRVKKSVIADRIDACLRSMMDSHDITYHDYREMCVKIGLALSNADLIPRGKRSRVAIRRIVETNCKEMRESLAKAGRLPAEPETKPVPPVLVYLRNRKSAA